MDFEIPYEPEEYLVHVTANSYLEDVVLNVSDKVLKPKSVKLGFTADINVLGGGDLQVDAKFIDAEAIEKATKNKSVESVVDLFAVRKENKVNVLAFSRYSQTQESSYRCMQAKETNRFEYNQ